MSSLKEDRRLFDDTLATDNGHQIQAHIIILPAVLSELWWGRDIKHPSLDELLMCRAISGYFCI